LGKDDDDDDDDDVVDGDDIVDIDDDVDEWKFGMSSDQLVNANGCALCSVSCIPKSPYDSLKNGWSILQQ